MQCTLESTLAEPLAKFPVSAAPRPPPRRANGAERREGAGGAGPGDGDEPAGGPTPPSPSTSAGRRGVWASVRERVSACCARVCVRVGVCASGHVSGSRCYVCESACFYVSVYVCLCYARVYVFLCARV